MGNMVRTSRIQLLLTVIRRRQEDVLDPHTVAPSDPFSKA